MKKAIFSDDSSNNGNNMKTIVKSEMKEQLRLPKKVLLFFSVVYLAVLVAIIGYGLWYVADLGNSINEIAYMAANTAQSTVSIERNGLLSADYLATVIPLLVALIGSFIAFLGMNRLKMFDDRIDQMRVDLLKEIESRTKNEVQSRQAEFEKTVLNSVDLKSEDFRELVLNSTNNFNQNVSDAFKPITSRLEDFEKKYGWLEASVSTEATNPTFDTICEAHVIVEKLRINKPNGYNEIVRNIVNRICDSSSSYSADADDYHNLAAELARGSLYYEACMLLEKGCKLFPNDIDLKADFIEYATKGGMLETAKIYVDELLELKNNSNGLLVWNWRCYEFVCDYFREIGAFTDAYNLCEEAISSLPNDEHGYRSKAEISMILTPGMDGINSAIAILEDVLAKRIPCAQCAVRLSNIYLSLGRLEDALRASNCAIREMAESQPSVGSATAFSVRANIYDKMFMLKLESGETDLSLVRLALSDYERALVLDEKQLSTLSPVVCRQALFRIYILTGYVDSSEPDCL